MAKAGQARRWCRKYRLVRWSGCCASDAPARPHHWTAGRHAPGRHQGRRRHAAPPLTCDNTVGVAGFGLTASSYRTFVLVDKQDGYPRGTRPNSDNPRRAGRGNSCRHARRHERSHGGASIRSSQRCSARQGASGHSHDCPVRYRWEQSSDRTNGRGESAKLEAMGKNWRFHRGPGNCYRNTDHVGRVPEQTGVPAATKPLIVRRHINSQVLTRSQNKVAIRSKPS